MLEVVTTDEQANANITRCRMLLEECFADISLVQCSKDVQELYAKYVFTMADDKFRFYFSTPEGQRIFSPVMAYPIIEPDKDGNSYNYGSFLLTNVHPKKYPITLKDYEYDSTHPDSRLGPYSDNPDIKFYDWPKSLRYHEIGVLKFQESNPGMMKSFPWNIRVLIG